MIRFVLQTGIAVGWNKVDSLQAHTHVHAHTHTCMHVSTCTHVCVYMHAHTHTQSLPGLLWVGYHVWPYRNSLIHSVNIYDF